MKDLSAYLITQRWPAKHPNRLQLYSLPTPNGVKVSMMLEETGLPYEAHLVDFNQNDQRTAEFLSLSPNGKIPAILDPNGPGSEAPPLFESGAILQYLAEKAGHRGHFEAWLVRNLIGIYEARELVEFDSFREVPAWLERGLARPAMQCGLTIPRRP